MSLSVRRRKWLDSLQGGIYNGYAKFSTDLRAPLVAEFLRTCLLGTKRVRLFLIDLLELFSFVEVGCAPELMNTCRN
jgi:hypothetical protein